MKFILFVIQVSLLLSFLKMHYNISLKDIFHGALAMEEQKTPHLLSSSEPLYTSYYSTDIIGDDILLLDNLSEKKKLAIWKNTSTKDEIIDFFPNMEMMEMVFNNKIEDNGKFKINFLAYIEEQHSRYITGEIKDKEFKESILNPSSSLTDSW